MVYDHGTCYGGFVDHVLGRDYVIESDILSLRTNNSSRRFQRWIKHSLFYQIITWVPFHIYDKVLCGLEDNFFGSCPWCGRGYFVRSKKGCQKLKNCCADTKKKLGSKPGSIATIGGGCGGSLAYDSQRDIVIDGRGKEYVSRDRL